jgi:glycosyltransferase involved in cell wall biosynthesis
VTSIRLTVVLTHPIQYYSPWFRYIAASAPELTLTVVYAIEPTAEQQGVGFDKAFEWDVPLKSGYHSITVRAAHGADRIDAASFFGLDVPQISVAIRATSPHVVLVPGWHSMTLIRALATCRLHSIPILYRGDSQLVSAPQGWQQWPWMLRTWPLLRQFDAFLTPGRHAHDYLRWFGIPDSRIFRVPHGIDNELFARAASVYEGAEARAAARREWQIDANAFVPLFVGKLIPSKRPVNLVRALAQLGAGTSALMVGSGALAGAIRAEADRLGVDVRFVGFLNQSAIGRAYAVADCLVLPSDSSETWGLVVNEALATGLPCVVSDAVGCAPDLVKPGETGYLHPLDDIDALASALLSIRKRSVEGHDWKPACRAAVGEYSFPVMTTGLVAACRSVLRRQPAFEHHTNPESMSNANQRF